MGNHLMGKLMHSPLETLLELLAATVLVLAVVTGIGVYKGAWTQAQVMQFFAPIVAAIFMGGINLVGLASVLGVLIAVVTAIHNHERALKIVIPSVIVAVIAWRIGGLDLLISLLTHPATVKGA